jgi:ABC-type antimicrobial peptide transport system ATPase subunit
MAKKTLKAWLYQEARKTSRNKEIKISQEKFRYIYQFIKINRKLIYSFLYLLTIQIILEISLPLMAKYKVASLVLVMNRQETAAMIAVLLITAVIYLTVSFFNIKKEKQIVIYLINKIREDWFSFFLNKKDSKTPDDKKGSLLAKMTYHFPLLQMGISNSIINIIKYIFYLLGVLILSALTSPTILIISLLSIIFNAVLMLAGYFVAKKYVSQETTLYSEIIRHITGSIYNLGFINQDKPKRSAKNKLNSLVELDTFFRIRRELWIVFGTKIIFVLLIIIATSSYIAELYFPRLFLSFNPGQVVAISIIMIYLSRLAYLSLKIGLFLYPVKLGIFLSVPDNSNLKEPATVKLNKGQKIEFISPKAKISKNMPYWKNISLNFDTGSRSLIFGDRLTGKTTIGLMLAGEDIYNPNAWIVKIDKQREKYQSWQTRFERPYFITNNFQRENILLEIITGKFKKDISDQEIEDVINLITHEKSLSFLLDLPAFLNTDFRKIAHSPLYSFATQAAHCLINEPKILIIDNLWLDLNYQEINDIIESLSNKLTNSIVIYLSSTDNEKNKYDQKYQITNQGIVKL